MQKHKVILLNLTHPLAKQAGGRGRVCLMRIVIFFN
jgi:hypothetical protein